MAVDNSNKILNNFKRLLRWLWEGLFIYLSILFTLLIPLIVILVIIHVDKIGSEFNQVDFIAFIGLILQLTGTVMIILSFRQKLMSMKNIGYFNLIKGYFNRFPLWRKKSNVSVSPMTGNFELKGYAPTVIIKPREEDIKEMVKYLDNRITQLQNSLDDLTTEIITNINALDSRLNLFMNNATQEIRQVRELVVDSSVSNILKDTFGVLCIIVGLILATFPKVIWMII